MLSLHQIAIIMEQQEVLEEAIEEDASRDNLILIRNKISNFV